MTLIQADGPAARSADELVARARSGDVVAFEQLYHTHVARVYGLCLRLCADVATAEELTQDVFVRAWEKLATFRGESAFGTWLHRMAINVVLCRRRSDGRRDARVTITGDPLRHDRGSGAVWGNAERMDLEAALAALPEASRTVFVLHEVEGYTHEEIATMTGRAEGTCKALLHRARRLLRERLL